MKTVSLPPSAPALMESTRAIGYNAPAAVADIIDNSIAAGARNVELWYERSDQPFLAILDDGSGMSETLLEAAMQYGSSSPTEKRLETDLGRYGLGMKTASLSQCRRLTVVSRQNGVTAGRCWDLDRVVETGEWTLQVLEPTDLAQIPYIERLNENQSGTLLLWEKLDRMLVGEATPSRVLAQSMNDIRDHLALVFHRYLNGGLFPKKFTISMNGVPVVGKDPFLLGRSEQIMDVERVYVDNHVILIRPYILPHVDQLTPAELDQLGGRDNLRNTQGFYVYRQKRLIVWGTWFRLKPKNDLSKLARVQIDIPNTLDDLWTLDVTKSTATPPSVVREKLKTIVDGITNKSEKRFSTRAKRERNRCSKAAQIWHRTETRDHEIQYILNRKHPLVQYIKTMGPAADQALESLLSCVEQGLPVQQMRAELGNEQKRMLNAQQADEQSIREQLCRLLAAVDELEERRRLLKVLAQAEPFCYYDSVVSQLMEENI